MQEFLLIPIAFLTSGVAAVMGMGGGILLIALMPGLVPAAAIIPLHAVTQLASNLSRAGFGMSHIDWRIIPPITLGAIAGASMGAGLYQQIDLRLLPGLIGLFILVFTWVPLPKVGGGGPLALFLLGVYQTGIGMLVGATGPVGAAVMLRRNTGRDWLVVNTAVYMTLNHALRVAAFALMGFSFGAWWLLLLGMIGAGIAGSWAGTRLRSHIPELDFQRLFRIAVTLLALRMIGHSIWQLA